MAGEYEDVGPSITAEDEKLINKEIENLKVKYKYAHS